MEKGLLSKDIKQSSLEKNALSMLIGIFIIGATFLILRPIVAEIISLKKENEQETQKLSKLNKKLLQLKELSDGQILGKYNMKEKMLELEAILPSKKPVISLLRILDTLAVDNDLSLENVKFAPRGVYEILDDKDIMAKKKSKETQLMEVSFIAKGTKESIISFAKKLQEVAPLINVEEVGFTMEEEKEDQLNTTFSIGAYYKYPLSDSWQPEDELPILSANDEQSIESLEDYKILPEKEATHSLLIGKEKLFKSQ